MAEVAFKKEKRNTSPEETGQRNKYWCRRRWTEGFGEFMLTAPIFIMKYKSAAEISYWIGNLESKIFGEGKKKN